MDVMLVLQSPYFLSLVAIALVLGLSFLVTKKPEAKQYTDIAIDLFAYIEDNYKTWGIQGNEKYDYFVKDFIARYRKDFGVVPTEDIIKNAVGLMEELVQAQNSVVKAE
jgi:hypothetical protein